MSYVISTVRPTASGGVMFEVVTDNLQRLFVRMRPKNTTAAQIDQTITQAIAALAAKPSPVR